MNKKILGLDLGTNSIGWALVEIDHEKKIVRILGIGSRILNMDAAEISKFESGAKIASTAAQRTEKRSPRKMNERYLLRRDRLHCVLNLLNSLPPHYKLSIEFETEKGKRSGKFKKGAEEKLAYIEDEKGKHQFLFMDSYKKMETEFRKLHPNLFHTKRNGKQTKIPYDWTLYYMRHKAITDKDFKLTKEELAWITLSFNQKRGYEKVIGQDEKLQKEGELRETFVGKVKSVNKINEEDVYEIVLVKNEDESVELFKYKEETKIPITEVGDLKEVEVVSTYDESGDIDSKNTEYIINEIRELLITDVRNTGQKRKENFVFEIELETGWIKEQQSKFTPKWKDTRRDFIVKTKYDEKGNRILKGADKGRNINAPKEEDWTLMKLKTETSLTTFNTKNNTKGVAPFIYYNLLQNPNQKIKGGLVTVIERDYYREELEVIYKNQEKFHPELKNRELYEQAIQLLYPNNINRQNTIKELDFNYLIREDILLYQRDLKSKKSLITDCQYETENYERTDEKTGKKYKKPLKAIHKFNPIYQEFRLWQFLKNLKIIQLEGTIDNETAINIDVTKSILTEKAKEHLFDYLNNREYVVQSQLLKELAKFHNQKISSETHKWNYPIYTDEEKKTESKELCNPTRYNFIVRTKRIKGFDYKSFLKAENEYRLWHFFYSVKKKDEFDKGLRNLITKLLDNSGLPLEYADELVKHFSAFGGYTNDYGTYSEKAIKKLLPFMRLGKYWNVQDVEKILSSLTHDVKQKVLDKEEINGEINDFKGLWLSSACYLVYGRYSEVGEVQFWETPYDIENYLRNEFRQHALNNPVVEKVLVETLHLVKDIWKYYADEDGIDEQGRTKYKKLFDRIHIELGREMKKNNKQKEKEDKQNKENRKTNERIIELLKELRKENASLQVKSPFQQEKLRILEDGLLASIEYDKDTTEYKLANGKITKKEIKEIIKENPNKIKQSDIERYRLWLDQRYQSPYTGKFIKLSDLFDRKKYEIEHIFPQERITLNSLSNKVICETEINKEKKAKTGYEFILGAKEKEVFCAAHNEKVKVLGIEVYESLVKKNFTDKKKEILLSKDIPAEFTNSQKANMQYISKMAMKLLSNIVREKDDDDDFRSKNVLATTGTITTTLKRHWKLNDIWNEIIAPRFQRLNDLTNSKLFGDYRTINGHQVFDNRIPEETNKNFDPKRIDHRHHALDALVIALTSENHVNYLNNISSQDDGDKLKTRKGIKYQLTNTRKGLDDEKEWYFLPPAQTKTKDGIEEYEYQYKNSQSKVFKDIAKESIENTVASFKQKNRIIRQRWNKYLKAENGEISVVKQEELNSKEKYNIRTQLHLDTFYGRVKLQDKTLTMSLGKALFENFDFIDKDLVNKIKHLQDKEHKTKQDIIQLLGTQYKSVKVYDKYVASRYGNELESFAAVTPDKIIKTIESITDTGIQKILKKHLSKYNTITKTIEEVVEYIDFVVDGEHKTALKKLLSENAKFDYIVIEKKEIRETEIFIKDLKEDIADISLIKHNPQLAFSSDGVKELNENIRELNNGKFHQPIYKVRMADAMGTKFPVSEQNTKSTKFVATASGNNAFCGVYQKGTDRKFFIPTLRESIASLKQNENPCPPTHPDDTDFKWIFTLNPLDLVYVPTEEEQANPKLVDFTNLSKEQINRIYKFTDGSGTTMNFVPVNIATPIIDISSDEHKRIKNNSLYWNEINETKKGETMKRKPLYNEIGLGSESKTKSQNTINKKQIKSACWKLKVDRLGNISKA